MRILVTGSAGFIGSYIAEALVAEGHEVFGADSCVGGRNTVKGCPLLVGDLSDTGFSRHVADAVKPSVLVHCAADPREGASWYRIDSVTRNNMGAYASILEACLRHKLEKVVLFSSMSVYGDQEPPPFREHMPPDPVDPYGVNKAAMEMVTKQMAAAHGFRWVILRPHNVIGPRQFPDPLRNVAMIFVNAALRGEKLRVYGDGMQTRALSNIRDSLPCYVRAILTHAVNEMTVNIGGEKPITIFELAHYVSGELAPCTVVFMPDRYGEVKHAHCDHTRAKTLLGFEEIRGWRQAVDDMITWARRNGPWDWEPCLVETPTAQTPEHWKVQL